MMIFRSVDFPVPLLPMIFDGGAESGGDGAEVSFGRPGEDDGLHGKHAF